ncbi:MAG TPA: DUF4190 domain-containing protein [Acidothermales bacterium]
MSDPYAQPPAEPPPGASQTPAAQPGAPWTAPHGYPPPQERGGTNGFAVASLVLGIIAGGVLAVIFGIIALVQIPKKNQTGKGMAIAGIVLGGLWTLAYIGFIVAAIVSTADRDSTTGEITESGEVSAFSLEVGDCVNDLQESEAVRSLPAVPCAEPHEGEVFALFDLPEGDYPAEPELIEQAETGCFDRLQTYAPEAARNPALELFYFYPLEASWPDDRQIVCIATLASGTMTGSIAE